MDRLNAPFRQAAAFFPVRLRRCLLAMESDCQEQAEEIRLRAGTGLNVLLKEDEVNCLDNVSRQELYGVVEIAARASFHRAMDKLRRGYLPLPGGHRLGVAGSAITREGRIQHFQEISSLSLRIAREIPGVGASVAEQLAERGLRGASCLILAPPGYGKTTLLRDLIRVYSDHLRLRVGVADERGEIAALCDGVPQFQIGRRVDVIDGCGKGEAGLLLLRSMNPQVIAMDEITSPEDVEALSIIAHCGTAVLATAHGSDCSELTRRPLYRPLLEQCCFRAVIRILRSDGIRRYMVEELPCSD